MAEIVKPTKTCFVVGAVGDDDSETRTHADWLLEEIIEPVFRDHFPNYTVKRSDRMPKPGMIDSEMIKWLVKAELVIADLTFLNPNAFYEIGIRHMKQMPIIHMHLEGQKIPFDVALHRSVKFNLNRPANLRAARVELQGTVAETEQPEFEVTNPVTHALGIINIDAQNDSPMQVVLEEIRGIKDRLQTIETTHPSIETQHIYGSAPTNLRSLEWFIHLQIDRNADATISESVAKLASEYHLPNEFLRSVPGLLTLRTLRAPTSPALQPFVDALARLPGVYKVTLRQG